MRAPTAVVTSALFGGAVGYSLHPPIAAQATPPNPQLDAIAKTLHKQGFQELPRNQSRWLGWHQQYMYSRAVAAQPQRSFWNPQSQVTESYYSIPAKYLDHMDVVYPTILDEGLAYAASHKLPSQVAVTGTLEIGPLKSQRHIAGPASGDEKILILRASPPEASGRKSSCRGELYWHGSSTPIASGRVIMIEPWWGKYVSYLL